MTDRIEAALAALDKATLGPWCPHYIHDLLRIGRKSLDITTDCDCLYEPDENDTALIAAAPDMAAEIKRLRKWQEEAVRKLGGYSFELASDLHPIFGKSKYADKALRDEDKAYLADLDRLIAEAKETQE